jgi:hypothetical protein
MNKIVQVFFKTDEPAKINAMLMQAYTADTLDLSNTQVIDHTVLIALDKIQEPMTDQSNSLDLSDVSIFETTSLVQDLQFLRLPKPGQPAPDDYFEPLIRIFSNGLAEFINSKLNLTNEQSICQAHEESITDLSGDIFSMLSGLELIQYYYWDLE